MKTEDNLFLDGDGLPRVLRGVTIYSGSPWLAEMAARIGFETVWIEMEHGPSGFEKVETLGMAAEAGGAAPAIRVPDGQRSHILRALEVGARLVIVPLVNDAFQAGQIVEFGKFPPLGKRGYNTRSRGVHYGLNDVEKSFAEANARAYLIAQIETLAAVKNIGAICSVEGLAGILVGPGDLSASMNCAGDLNCPRMIKTVTRCIRYARSVNKHAGILVTPGPLLDAALNAGCDLAYIGGDVTDLAAAWPQLLSSVKPERNPAKPRTLTLRSQSTASWRRRVKTIKPGVLKWNQSQQ